MFRKCSNWIDLIYEKLLIVTNDGTVLWTSVESLQYSESSTSEETMIRISSNIFHSRSVGCLTGEPSIVALLLYTHNLEEDIQK